MLRNKINPNLENPRIACDLENIPRSGIAQFRNKQTFKPEPIDRNENDKTKAAANKIEKNLSGVIEYNQRNARRKETLKIWNKKYGKILKDVFN